MPAMQSTKQFRTLKSGIAVPADTPFMIKMNQNDRYLKDYADNYYGKLLAINTRDSEVTMNPNTTWYHDLFTGTIRLRPLKYITLTMNIPQVEYSLANSYMECWVAIGESPSDFWIFMSYRGEDGTDTKNGPVIMSRTIKTYDIGVTADKEYPYTTHFSVGNASPPYPKITIPAREGSPIQFTIEEVGAQ